jgi:TPR repeat protein
VFAEFTVMPDGRARHPRLVYAVPLGFFEDAARRGVLTGQYPVRPSDTAPAHCRLMIRFVTPGASKGDYPRLTALAKATETKAQAGDVEAEVFYGMLLAGMPQLGHGPRDGLPWFLKAAQAGARVAQYEVGASLLQGVGCHCEATKGEVWLLKAAEADQPDAQVTLAQYALRGTPAAKQTEQAKMWLERATANSSRDAMLYLSALLAATPFAELRDPARALRLLDTVKSDLPGDPEQFEIRAAAQASAGAFAKAVANEREAIGLAAKLGWDLSPLNERLTSYQSQRPWYGNLLAM